MTDLLTNDSVQKALIALFSALIGALLMLWFAPQIRAAQNRQDVLDRQRQKEKQQQADRESFSKNVRIATIHSVDWWRVNPKWIEARPDGGWIVRERPEVRLTIYTTLSVDPKTAEAHMGFADVSESYIEKAIREKKWLVFTHSLGDHIHHTTEKCDAEDEYLWE